MEKERAGKNKVLLTLSALLLVFGGGLLFVCRFYPAAADWYVSGPFQFFPNVVGRLTGLLPFSLYEVILYLLVAAALWRISHGIVCLLQRRRPLRAKDGLCRAVFFVAAVFCMLSAACLANYGRSPLAEELDLTIQPSSVEELQALCRTLAADAEAVMDEVERDSEGRFTIQGDDVRGQAQAAMYHLGEMYEVFAGYYPKPKPVLWSEGMSYIDLTGMYSPFTIEANYNADAPDDVIPYTICHELAHLRGLIREEEAGFAAWLACYHSDSPQLRYSGAISALRYGLNALYKQMPYEEYAQFYNALPLPLRRDLWENSQYWKRHRSVSYQVGNKVNDAYLKVNAQEGGVKSYGRMIDLLLAYRRTGAELT